MIFGLPLDPVVFALPIFALLIIIELIIDVKEKLELYTFKDSIASISMGLGSVVVNIGVKIIVFSAFTFLYQFRLFELEYIWWVWILVFFSDDFTFYWHHRLSHQVRILWAAHVNHHSSTHYNLSTALRQSWAELLYKYIWWIWMPLIGFPPMMIFTMISISLIYQFWIHTEIVTKMGLFGILFNTPSHHRVHHGSNVRYMDKNHAGILIIWDKFFGTFQPELDEDPVVFGITTNIKTYNPLIIATHEFSSMFNDIRHTKGFLNKIKILINPPGWKPNDNKQTASYLQKKLKVKEDLIGEFIKSHEFE